MQNLRLFLEFRRTDQSVRVLAGRRPSFRLMFQRDRAEQRLSISLTRLNDPFGAHDVASLTVILPLSVSVAPG